MVANVVSEDTKPRDLIPGRVLISRKQLLEKVPLCIRTILDMEKRGAFPRRFAIGSRLVAWDLEEVDTWIAQQREAAVQRPAPAPKRRS